MSTNTTAGDVKGLIGLLSLVILAASMGRAVASDCPITEPERDQLSSDALNVVLPPGKRFVFTSESGGFIDQHGAVGSKVGWFRNIRGQLDITGRRLDGQSPRLRAWIPDGYGDTGFQPAYVLFPTPGCWEIVGSVGRQKLVFVVEVELVAPGPSWRLHGPEPGWRETGG